jgi:hypothetical protein
MPSIIELDIGRTDAPGIYQIEIIRSPAGDASATFELEPVELIDKLGELQQTLLASSVSSRRIVGRSEASVRGVGQRLFEALFADHQVAAVYRASHAVASDRGESLRIVLRLSATELAALPWESMFDPSTDSYVSRREPLVRYIPVAFSPPPLKVRLPLRILVLIASPRGLAQLDIEKERENLTLALHPLLDSGSVAVEWLEHATWPTVQDRLLAEVWHIVHFIGHGDFDIDREVGVLALENDYGRLNRVPADSVVDLLREAQPMPRLIVLNACESSTSSQSDLFSGVAAALVRGGVSAVTAMQFEISDQAAIAFSRGFYTAIGHGRSVDEAVRSGRVAIVGLGPDSLEWITPTLYLRGQEGHLFNLTDSTSEPTSEPVLAERRSRASKATEQRDVATAVPLYDTVLAESPDDDSARQGRARAINAARQARQEAEERARQEAEERARREAAERARREAEERARQEAEERARQKAAPAGLRGSSAGGRVDLRWDPPLAGSMAVVGWEVHRGGSRVGQVTEPRASDHPPGRGSYTYTVTAVGADGQHSPESSTWVRLGRRRRWLIPALAILAAVLATAGFVLWAPWPPVGTRTEPPAASPPVAPAGLKPAWQKLKTGFHAYSYAGVAAHNGELWVVGGLDANGKRDEVLVFNPKTKKWRNGPKLPIPISHAPLVSTGDKLYLLGGVITIDGISVPVATVYSLDTRNPDGAWIKEDELPAPRYGGAAAWDGKRLVFAGGAETFELNTPRPAAAEIWELRSGKWKSIDDVLQPARDRLAAATDGKGRIWFVGGAQMGPPVLRRELVPRKIYADVEVLRGNKVGDSKPIRTAIQGAPAVWTHDTGTCVFGGSTILPNQTAMPVTKVQCLEGTAPAWPDLPEARYNAGAAVIDSTVYVVGSRSCSPCLARDRNKPEIVLALRFG